MFLLQTTVLANTNEVAAAAVANINAATPENVNAAAANINAAANSVSTAVANVNAAATTVTAITSNAVTDIGKFLLSINWASPTWDLFIVLFFIVTVFLYGMSLGRDRVIIILVAIYMALAVVSNAPFLSKLHADVNVGQFFAFKITTFLALFVLLFFLFSRSALQNIFGDLAAGRWWQVFIFSVFHVGLLVSVTLSFLPPDAVSHLAPITRQLFASEAGRFGWIVAPILGMVLLKNKD